MAKNESGIMILRNKKGLRGHSYGPPRKIIQSSNNTSMINFSKQKLKGKKTVNHNRSLNMYKGRFGDYDAVEYSSEYT